jgi:hypothetical protein
MLKSTVDNTLVKKKEKKGKVDPTNDENKRLINYLGARSYWLESCNEGICALLYCIITYACFITLNFRQFNSCSRPTKKRRSEKGFSKIERNAV